MAIDSAKKRYSAINVASPWRGPNVIPDATIPVGERQAIDFMYYGIASAAPPGPPVSGGEVYSADRGLPNAHHVTPGAG